MITDTHLTRHGVDILLRSPLLTDLDVLFDYAQKIEAEDTCITLNPDEPISLAEERRHLEEVVRSMDEKKGIYLYAFDEDVMIGSVSIVSMGRRKNHVGRFGIALLDVYRGKGIGRFMAEQAMMVAKRDLHMRPIFLEVFASNLIAQSFYTALGFQYMGTMPKAVLFHGDYEDELYMYKKLDMYEVK